jgi:hypothetical protein
VQNNCHMPVVLNQRMKQKFTLRIYSRLRCNKFMYISFVNSGDPKHVRSVLALLSSHKGMMMTLQGRNM